MWKRVNREEQDGWFPLFEKETDRQTEKTQTEIITAIRWHQVYLKYLIFMIFMLLMHISVVLPDQLKHVSWFQLCLLSRDAARNFHTFHLSLKKEAKIGTLWWCSKPSIKIELDELQLQMRDIILSFPCKLIFFSCFPQWLLKPVFLHCLIQKGKGLEGQEVVSLVKKKIYRVVHLLGGKRKRKRWFYIKSTGNKASMKSASTGGEISMRNLLACALPTATLTDGTWTL